MDINYLVLVNREGQSLSIIANEFYPPGCPHAINLIPYLQHCG